MEHSYLKEQTMKPTSNEADQEIHMRSRLQLHDIKIEKNTIHQNKRKVTAQFAEFIIDSTSWPRAQNEDLPA